MNPRTLSPRWLLMPLGGVVAAGALFVSGGLTSAQTPDSNTTETPASGSSTQTSDMPNYDDILAEEIGISVEELQAARSNAQDKYIDQLAEAGAITEEQAEELKTWSPVDTIRELLDHVNLVEIREFLLAHLAEAFDMERDALEQDLSEGMTLKEIAEEQDVSTDDIRTGIQTQIEEMLDMAVVAGFLSEEQATDIGDAIDELIGAIARITGGSDDTGTTSSGWNIRPDAEETPAVTTP